MVFSSITFLFYFLPLFLLCYYLTPKKFKNWTLLLASIGFYSWGAPKFIFILLASTIIDFYLVKRMSRCTSLRKKKMWISFSLVLNLGLLAWFKYANFFVETVQGIMLHWGIESTSWTEVLLPIGISFYTFQTITYAVDVYRGTHQPLKKVWDYVLYIIMFPQLIAGPIVRFHEIADQITDRRSKLEDVFNGFIRFSIGLSKKVLIANVLAETANEIFYLPIEQLTTGDAWVGILAYTFQIYFDFSGYSDMAIGLGRMLGFKFPENFNNPYISKSITEFWRRWHITLGAFMRDYLYIPLGGNRVSKMRLFFNLWLVFALSGLWHGASWNFVLWGVYHGLFLIIDRLFLLKLYDRLGKVIPTLITFTIVVLGWVIFRIESFTEARLFYSKLFEFDSLSSLFVVNKEFVLFTTLAILFSFITLLPFGSKLEAFAFETESISRRRVILAYICTGLLFLSTLSLLSGSFNPFIYFRF